MKIYVKYQFEENIEIEKYLKEIENKLGFCPHFFYDKNWLIISDYIEYHNKSIPYLASMFNDLLCFLLVEYKMVQFLVNNTVDKIEIKTN